MKKSDIAKMSNILDSILNDSVPSASMGVSALVSLKGKVIYSRAIGNIKKLNFKYREDTIYDLASITKPLVTSLLACKLLASGKITLRDTIGELGLFPEFKNLQGISIESLMTHTSGLIPDKPLYKEGRSREKYLFGIDREAEKAIPYSKELYSDLNYILLAFILEELNGKSLDRIWNEEVAEVLGLKSSGFNPTMDRKRIAPTEDTKDRGLVWGKVHDEKSYYIGGVAGHAGLFSNTIEIWKIMQSLIDGSLLPRKVFELATANKNEQFGGMFGLGWMTKQPAQSNRSDSFYYNAFMGDFAPYGTIGHTGFTGTSVCANNDLGIICILLTNRVYPTRESDGILRLRRRFHNAIFYALS